MGGRFVRHPLADPDCPDCKGAGRVLAGDICWSFRVFCACTKRPKEAAGPKGDNDDG